MNDYFVSRQPNGLLCRFSSSEGTITHYNMTEEEYVAVCMQEAGESAKDVVRNGLVPFCSMKQRMRGSGMAGETVDAMLCRMEEPADT